MNSTVFGILLLIFSGFTLPSSAGPFYLSIPVQGMDESDLESVGEVFKQRFGQNITQLSLKDGALQFYAGGEHKKSILRLNQVIEAIESIGFKVDMSSWLLKKQDLGIYVRSHKDMSITQFKETINSIGSMSVKVIGNILDKEQTCIVINIMKEVDFELFNQALKNAGIQIQGLCWGHWFYGWNIIGAHAKHETTIGAHLKK